KYPILSIEDINQLPIIKKEEFRNNLKDIYTLNKNNGIVSKTGGTTGKSLEVIFTKEDNNKKFAALDYFRGQFGYKLGKRTAWFSGKSLLTERDLKRNRFWKMDRFHNVKYYSTFHIKKEYLIYYVKDLINFSP